MEVRFFNGRKKVYTVKTAALYFAIDLVNDEGIEWTRYKIY